MGARRDMARDRIGWIDVKRFGTLYLGGRVIAMCQHEARHSIGKRRLADALRTPDQPGMRNTSAAVGIQQRHLGFAMPCQCAGFAGMNGRKLRFDVAGAHAEVTTLSAPAAKKRSRNTAHTLAATASASALASIKTHRCGSAAAICR